jgi:hypothetical protein
LPVQEPAYHADEARCVRGAALAALQALAEERLVQGIPDDVDGEHWVRVRVRVRVREG